MRDLDSHSRGHAESCQGIAMRRVVIIIVALALFSACADNTVQRESLDGVEAIIEENPSEALRRLSAMDTLSLRSKPLKARYALLKSMALDKTYIDKTDFNVIQPAVDYYSKRGSATEKLRAAYYQGRIYQNKGNLGLAMDCFAGAESEVEESEDRLTAARLYSAEALIYERLYDFENAIEYNTRAAALFREEGREKSYINMLSRIVNEYTVSGDASKAAEYLDLIEMSDSSSYSYRQNKYYWSSLLAYSVAFKKSRDEIGMLLSDYFRNVPSGAVDWLSVATAFCFVGNLDKAGDALEKYVSTAGVLNKTRYAAVCSKVYRLSGDSEKALEYYEKYVRAADSARFASYRTDAQFVSERYRLEEARLEEQARKNRVLFVGMTVLFAAAVVIFALVARYRHSKLEQSRLLVLYDRIAVERDALSGRLVESENVLNEDARAALNAKLALFDRFLSAGISEDSEIDRKAFKDMERMLFDREEFMELNRLSYKASHPSFVRYLEGKGLSGWEVGYCCLYAMGLKGKDIGKYLQKGGHFNISSRIRTKLGISSHDTNLGIYIRKLLSELG